MSEILVNYPTIHQAADDCRKTSGELQGTFEGLKADLSPLIDTWDGQAVTAWGERQAEWDDALQELKVFLDKLVLALPEIADGYSQTDKNVTNLF